MDITIAIPTYNGAKRFPLVLDALFEQIQTEAMTWEIIVIDNNSSDDTAQIVQKYQKKWGDALVLEYFFEARQGLAFARERAIQEAKGELVAFLDDDNIPAVDWVYQAVQFSRKYPRAGAYGGRILADFEIDPPANINKIIGFFAIRDRGDIANLYEPKILSLPPGAGLVIRKQVWQKCCAESYQFIGRIGNSMLGGSDYEMLVYIYKIGWEIWYNPDMYIQHKIPAHRLERDYLFSLIHGSCLTFFPLKMIIAKNWEKPTIVLRTVLGNLYKAIKYKIQNWGKLQEDVIAQCELQIYISRIASFFYYLNQIARNFKSS